MLTFYGGNYLITECVENNLHFDKVEAERWEFPPTHWIMMALNNTGGYVQEDVDYTKSFDTYEKN